METERAGERAAAQAADQAEDPERNRLGGRKLGAGASRFARVAATCTSARSPISADSRSTASPRSSAPDRSSASPPGGAGTGGGTPASAWRGRGPHGPARGSSRRRWGRSRTRRPATVPLACRARSSRAQASRKSLDVAIRDLPVIGPLRRAPCAPANAALRSSGLHVLRARWRKRSTADAGGAPTPSEPHRRLRVRAPRRLPRMDTRRFPPRPGTPPGGSSMAGAGIGEISAAWPRGYDARLRPRCGGARNDGRSRVPRRPR